MLELDLLILMSFLIPATNEPLTTQKRYFDEQKGVLGGCATRSLYRSLSGFIRVSQNVFMFLVRSSPRISSKIFPFGANALTLSPRGCRFSLDSLTCDLH